jgi:hypothetical protein
VRKETARSAFPSSRGAATAVAIRLALRYVQSIDGQLLDQLDHVRAVLVKNAR